VIVLAVVLALGIGVALGALGGGGSILAVPVLVYVAGQTPSAATATSLVAVGAAAAVGVIGHARLRRVRWGAAAAFVATGVAGSWLGSHLNGSIDPQVLLLGFSVLMLVAAHRMLTACPSCTNVGEQLAVAAAGGQVPARRQLDAAAIVRVVAAGSVVGLLTGLFGVGGGFIIVPALTLALGMSLPVAIGTSLVVIVGNALVSLGFRGVGAVDWGIAVPFTVAMLLGSLAGSNLGHRIPVERSLKAFSVLLVAVALANGTAAVAALAT
jgi:uncharacterized membrane protein YfcA